MHRIKAYKLNDNHANINPLSVKRKWMDETYDAHAYHCFPVSLANQLGYSLSFPEDISFIWDGISDSSGEHVKILSGHKYVYTERANATISFKTGLMFSTEEDISLLHMPTPNHFIDGATPFTSLISTSFYHGEFPCAWMITRPNVEITIRANTPIISILPIDLNRIQDSEIHMENTNFMPKSPYSDGYRENVKKIIESGKWTDFYRNATNDIGEKIGRHQVKSIKLKVLD